MPPAQFREALTAIGWTQRGLATMLECDDRLVRRWASGDAAVPRPVAEWLAGLAATHLAMPPPVSWKTRSRPLAAEPE